MEWRGKEWKGEGRRGQGRLAAINANHCICALKSSSPVRATHERGLDGVGRAQRQQAGSGRGGGEAGVGAAGGRQLLFLIATESNGKNNNSAFNFIALSTLLGLA